MKFELEKFKKKRSNGQNAYLHTYLFPEISRVMTEKLGVTVSNEMAKVILKSRCAVDYVQKLDEWIVTPTSKMSTVRMVKFIEDCLKYMATKYEVALDEPNQEQWNQIKEP